MKPVVSIIVPVYNTENYLSRCLISILNQSFTDFEVIMVNDGSTDGSGAICKRAAEKDSRVRYIEQDNHGAAHARNTGLNAAKGRYITFVDSDDVINKEYLGTLLKITERYNTDLTACEFTNNDVETNKKDRRDSFNRSFVRKGKNLRPWLTRKIFENGKKQKLTNMVCKIFKSEIIKQNDIKFINGMVEYEDALFLMEYYQYVSAFAYIHKSLYDRRWRPDSLVNSYKPNVFEDMTFAMKEYERLKRQFSIKDDQDSHLAFEMLRIAAGNNVVRPENPDNLKNKYKSFYTFAESEMIREKFSKLKLAKIVGKKNLAKAILIKYRMLWLWACYERLKDIKQR